MQFNQSQSYRWVSQPRPFPGQQLEWNRDRSPQITTPTSEWKPGRRLLTSIKESCMRYFNSAKPKDSAIKTIHKPNVRTF